MNDTAQLIQIELKEMEKSLAGRLLRWHASYAEWAMDPAELTTVTRTHGKHLRPRLLLITNGMCGGTQGLATREVAEALELYHGVSLIYDDVQDNSRTRRGEPAHHMSYSTSATLSLCALLSRHVILILLESEGLKPADRLWMLQQLTHSQLSVGLGQMAETAWIRDEILDLPVEKYWRAIEGKTASLFEFAAVAGAYLGSGGDEAIVAAYRSLGNAIGILFQLVDDYADVFLPNTDGKPRCQDIREAKRTLFLLHTRQALSAEDRKELDRLTLLAERTEDQVQWILCQMQKMGAREAGQTHIRRLAAEVRTQMDDLLRQFPANPAFEQEIRSLVTEICRGIQ